MFFAFNWQSLTGSRLKCPRDGASVSFKSHDRLMDPGIKLPGVVTGTCTRLGGFMICVCIL